MTNAHRERTQILVGVLVCFFLSGLTALVYEVIWIRMLGLVFGHTVFAITTVLAAFMGGLALGSVLFGRLIDQRQQPLFVYGVLEVGIGISCLVVPWALEGVKAVYLTLARALELQFFAFSLAQFALVTALLLIPTTLMGATLPVLSRFFVEDAATLGKRVGFLYALNTFGAVLGTALAGYALLPAFGMQGSIYLAATLNVGIGALAIVFDLHLRRLASVEDTPAAPAPAASSAGPAVVPRLVVVLAATGLGVSGAASMIYEIAWTRALALVIGSSTYAFTAMLVAFLVGIAAGSALFSKLWAARPVSGLTFALIQGSIGVSALAILPTFERLPDLVLQAFTVSINPGFVLVVQILLSILAMIVPTLLIGSSFPCAVRVAVHGVERVGFDVGRLYAINTLGAIVGTLLAGFLLIPAIGAQSTVKVAVLLNVLTGTVVALGTARALSWRQWGVVGAFATATVAGLAWIPAWNQAVMASGVAVYGHGYRNYAGRVDASDVFGRHPVLLYEDGLTATVSVHRKGEFVYLRVNGKTDASNGLDMHTQLMSAHIPMLTHPAPRAVLIIGLASGITVGAATQHPVERIDVVEIEPAMLKAAGFFTKENRNALADPRVRVVIGDGRNFLLSTPHRYDVIISEPSNPWIRGLATLFSQEFYELARSRLAPGGVMLQWIQGYGFHPVDLKMVVATFRTSFPATTMWQTHGLGDYLLLGATAPGPLDLRRIEAAYRDLPGLREDMHRSGLRSPAALFANFLLTEGDTERYARNGGLNTDDLLPLEFSAPRSLYQDTAQLNFRIIKTFKTEELPALAAGRERLVSVQGRYDRGMAYVKKNHLNEAAEQFERALRTDPRHVPSLVELGAVLLTLNQPLRAVEALDAAVRHDPRSAEAYFRLAQVYHAQKLTAKAIEVDRRAVALAPRQPRYRSHLAFLLREDGRLEQALEQYRAALAVNPRDAAIMMELGATYLRQRRPADALGMLEEARSLRPDDPAILHHLGRGYLALHQHANAAAALARARDVNPFLAPVHADLGAARLGLGDTAGAITAFERSLALDPFQLAVSETLSVLYHELDGRR